MIGSTVRAISVIAAIAGIIGVGLLVLRNHVALDPIGVAAALGGALSMAFGTILTRKWQPPVSSLVVAAWQLTAGGLLLLPVALWLEPALPPLSPTNLAGLGYLVIFTALTYILWFRGVSRLEPAAVSSLGFLSPLTAVILGWAILGESLSPLQIAGAGVVLASVWMSQQAAPNRAVGASRAPKKASST